ncbi:hypothetical protein H310_06908 [Aphanomyces invadans]|uniref:FYVE-type domain-containing protein n=1 Tax=Aphanomyces invadans TaxID=157072 RepID=A0A024U541_9STRA|nr:hypothetical protein H310_06908 [Aphanomyces invadans]ETW01350.1 hypothetical protein H310_06908 [Aphanomyces invadans]|eukprot:XP_008870348.1 hypothetical protein H310_06908 [Aphanomyces invadans]
MHLAKSMAISTPRHSRRRQLSPLGQSSSTHVNFPTVAMTSQEENYLVAQATRQHEALLAKHHDNLHTFRTLEALVDKVEVCRTIQTWSNVIPFRARICMAATLEEVYSLVANLTDDDIVSTVAHSDELADMKLLYDIPVNEEKHVAVRWFALKQPKPLAIRDFCVLEMQEELVDYAGRRVLALSTHSTHFDWCPDMKSTLGYIRGDILSSGLICTESDEPGMVEIHYYVDMDYRGGALPMWLYRLRMRHHVSARLSHLYTRVHELRLAECISTSYVPLVPKSTRRHCRGCTKTFHVLRRKCHCRNCGDVFCWSCTHVWKLEHFKQPQRVCRGCSDHVNVRTTSRRGATSGDVPLKSCRSQDLRSMRSNSKWDASKWDLSSRWGLLDTGRTSDVSSPVFLVCPEPSESLTSAILQVETMLEE